MNLAKTLRREVFFLQRIHEFSLIKIIVWNTGEVISRIFSAKMIKPNVCHFEERDPSDSEYAKQISQETLQRLAIDCGATCGDFSSVEMTKMRVNTRKN